VLTFLYGGVYEFFDMAAVDTYDVVVVHATVEFEHSVPVIKAPAYDKPGGLELGQYPINRCQANICLG
jgi:hypothetical protein